MDKRDSDGFFSMRLVCMDSDSSCNKADSLLTVANWSSIPCQCVPYTFVQLMLLTTFTYTYMQGQGQSCV